MTYFGYHWELVVVPLRGHSLTVAKAPAALGSGTVIPRRRWPEWPWHPLASTQQPIWRRPPMLPQRARAIQCANNRRGKNITAVSNVDSRNESAPSLSH